MTTTIFNNFERHISFIENLLFCKLRLKDKLSKNIEKIKKTGRKIFNERIKLNTRNCFRELWTFKTFFSNLQQIYLKFAYVVKTKSN